jgi:hypothetical protein
VRRQAQRLSKGDVMVDLRNEMFRLVQANQRDHRKVRKLLKKKHVDQTFVNSLNAAILEREPQIASQRFCIDMADKLFDQCNQFEEECLLEYYAKQDVSKGQNWDRNNQLETEVKEAIFKNFLFHSGAANRAVIFIWTRHDDIRRGLVKGYMEFAKSRDLAVTCYSIVRASTEIDDKKKSAILKSPDEVMGGLERRADVYRRPESELFDQKYGPLLGVALEVTGPAAFPMFGYEAGRHQFKNVNTRDALVEVVGEKLAAHRVSDEILTLGPFDQLAVKQRVYDIPREVIVDVGFGHVRELDFANIGDMVRGCAEKALEYHLNKFME